MINLWISWSTLRGAPKNNESIHSHGIRWYVSINGIDYTTITVSSLLFLDGSSDAPLLCLAPSLLHVGFLFSVRPHLCSLPGCHWCPAANVVPRLCSLSCRRGAPSRPHRTSPLLAWPSAHVAPISGLRPPDHGLPLAGSMAVSGHGRGPAAGSGL